MSKSNIARQLAQVQPGTLHVGVDLALEKNVVVVINEKAERLDHFSFPQDRGGYDYFLRRLEGLRQKHQASEVVVAMEPSNYFWKLLAKELEEKKIPYHLVNAYTVKKHREGNQLDRSKDDRRDAGQIAELSRNGHYTETRLQKGAYEELRQYATLYDQLMQAIRREKNVLWGLVGQVFPELSQVFKDLSWRDMPSLPGIFCGSSQHSPAKLSKTSLLRYEQPIQAKSYVSQNCAGYTDLAATSIGVTEGLQAIQLAIQVHLAELQTFQKQLKRVTSAMTACLASLPESPLSTFHEISQALFPQPSFWRKSAIPIVTILPLNGSSWPGSNLLPTLPARSSAAKPPCRIRVAPVCAPCSTSPACDWSSWMTTSLNSMLICKGGPITHSPKCKPWVSS